MLKAMLAGLLFIFSATRWVFILLWLLIHLGLAIGCSYYGAQAIAQEHGGIFIFYWFSMAIVHSSVFALISRELQ